ncbi:MAG: hypothetical protein CSA62_04390 [Planctomycetota bacterium]|nr:MAG: hypothetical protein CSA62_04390 [Planctomycetota bacterium]
MVEGETYWGKVRNSKEEALQDWINLGNRAAAVKQVEELLAAFDLVTSGLLPRTTADAKSKGRQWHVVRLALAVNFDGPL